MSAMRDYEVRMRQKSERIQKIETIGKYYDQGYLVKDIVDLVDDSLDSIQHQKEVYEFWKRCEEAGLNHHLYERLKSYGQLWANRVGRLKKYKGEELVEIVSYVLYRTDPSGTRKELHKVIDNAMKGIDVRDPAAECAERAHEMLKNDVSPKWLYETHNIGSATEVTLDYESEVKHRIDVLGFGNGFVYGIEVKAALQDFRSNKSKLLEYSKYCNYLYLLTDERSVVNEALMDDELVENGIGVLYYAGLKVEVMRTPIFQQTYVPVDAIERLKENCMRRLTYLTQIQKNERAV